MTKVSILIHIWDGDMEGNRFNSNIVRLYSVGTIKGEEDDDKRDPDQSKRKSLKNTGGGVGGGNGLVFCNLSFILMGHLKYTPCNHIYSYIDKWNFAFYQQSKIDLWLDRLVVIMRLARVI